MNSVPETLRRDAILAPIIEKIGALDNELDADSTRPRDAFLSLARIIVGQQLSTKAARTIWNRVDEFFGADFSPAAVLQTDAATLRTLGLSGQKSGYLHSLAQHVAEGRLEIARFDELSDAQIKAEIVAVKGLGPWSADMFLMFTLGRPDVLPVGDLGIQEAFKRVFALENRPNAAQMEALSRRWQPHRTLACRYLWRFLDNE